MFTRTLPTRELVQENNFVPTIERHHPRKRMIQYSLTSVMERRGCGVLDAPLEPVIGLAEGETRRRGTTANDEATRATIRKAAALLVARHRGQLGHVLQQDPAAL